MLCHTVHGHLLACACARARLSVNKGDTPNSSSSSYENSPKLAHTSSQIYAALGDGLFVPLYFLAGDAIYESSAHGGPHSSRGEVLHATQCSIKVLSLKSTQKNREGSERINTSPDLAAWGPVPETFSSKDSPRLPTSKKGQRRAPFGACARLLPTSYFSLNTSRCSRRRDKAQDRKLPAIQNLSTQHIEVLRGDCGNTNTKQSSTSASITTMVLTTAPVKIKITKEDGNSGEEMG